MRKAVIELGRPRGCFLGFQSAPPPPGTFIEDWCATNFLKAIHLPTSEVKSLNPWNLSFAMV